MKYKLLTWNDDDGLFTGFEILSSIKSHHKSDALTHIILSFEDIFRELLEDWTNTILPPVKADYSIRFSKKNKKHYLDYEIDFENGEYNDFQKNDLFGYKFQKDLTFLENIDAAKEFYISDLDAFEKHLHRTWSIKESDEIDDEIPFKYRKLFTHKFLLCKNDMIPFKVLQTINLKKFGRSKLINKNLCETIRVSSKDHREKN